MAYTQDTFASSQHHQAVFLAKGDSGFDATMPATNAAVKRKRASGGSSSGPKTMPQSASEKELKLAASLFGGAGPLSASKRGKRPAQKGVDGSFERDGGFGNGEGSDYEENATDDWHNETATEQYLDDDQLFTVDTGVDDAAEDDARSRSSSSSSEAMSGSDEESGDDDVEDDREDKLEGPSRRSGDGGRRRQPAWTDPASASLVIPLAGGDARANDGTRSGTQKLRRLRETPDEKEVSGAEYEMRLRRMYEKLHPRPQWASLDRRSGRSGDSTSQTSTARDSLAHLLSRDAGFVKRSSDNNKDTGKVKKSRRSLQAGKLDVQRLRNANEAQGRSNLSQIEALSFHPSARAHVMLAASKDRRLRLFQINGTNNPHLETVHFPDLPLKTAHFDPTGSSIVVSGPRPFFYTHDLEAGKTTKSTPWRSYGSNDESTHERDLSNLAFAPSESALGQRRRLAVGGRRGAVYLLDWGQVGGSGGGSLLGTLRMNAPLAGMAWDPRRDHSLVSLSTQGTLHTWDVRNMACEVQRSDAGLFAPTGLAASPAGGDFWAAGSDTGIVNMYGREAVEGSSSERGHGRNGQPAVLPLEARKSIDNIVTATTTLRFNPTGEVLAIASDKKKDALKFVCISEGDSGVKRIAFLVSFGERRN